MEFVKTYVGFGKWSLETYSSLGYRRSLFKSEKEVDETIRNCQSSKTAKQDGDD